MPGKMKIGNITFYPSDINASDITLLIIDAEIQSSKKDRAEVYTLSYVLQDPVAQYQIRKTGESHTGCGRCSGKCLRIAVYTVRKNELHVLLLPVKASTTELYLHLGLF